MEKVASKKQQDSIQKHLQSQAPIKSISSLSSDSYSSSQTTGTSPPLQFPLLELFHARKERDC